MAETIYGWTDPAKSPYPPYMNLARDGDRYSLTVRQVADCSGQFAMPGPCATIKLGRHELSELLVALEHERPLINLGLMPKDGAARA